MGILAAPPANFSFLGPVNYNRSAIGVFLGPYPPTVTYVNSRWIRRGVIRVHQSGIYYLFECYDAYDLDGIIRQHSTVFEGRIINLRRYHRSFIPQEINFDTTRLWVRVQGLPLLYLTREWANQILSHVGFIEEYEQVGVGLPMHANIRVRMLVDTSQLLIPGCFVPVEGDRVVWAFFRHEGAFKFNKSCGYIGHHSERCKVKKDVSSCKPRCRLAALERRGMRVLYGPGQQAYYTNYVKGLPDIFRYRNPKVNLIRPSEPEVIPFMDRNGREIRIYQETARGVVARNDTTLFRKEVLILMRLKKRVMVIDRAGKN
ncbi:uncharacterized protein LOC110735097 [Chenopodium quinoa]|uniref:uncharacterized protein LOC110735097 n=1 Tax=Chenopodium quinoa TaxID=63459 RepID=UPI000B780595|nr:uncharacterized protein LOC110735097 [Chenopodium quinoa]XP_021770936.1 uncharacterized protein LOC110735097 [Chenopodium quinoa]